MNNPWGSLSRRSIWIQCFPSNDRSPCRGAGAYPPRIYQTQTMHRRIRSRNSPGAFKVSHESSLARHHWLMAAYETQLSLILLRLLLAPAMAHHSLDPLSQARFRSPSSILCQKLFNGQKKVPSDGLVGTKSWPSRCRILSQGQGVYVAKQILARNIG